MIDRTVWSVHILVALVFTLDKIEEGDQIDHVDGNTLNNWACNLIPRDVQSHVAKTAADNPTARAKMALSQSQTIRLVSSTTKATLVGLEKPTSEWSGLLGIGRSEISGSLRRGKVLHEDHKFEYVVEPLLEGETEFENSVCPGNDDTVLVKYKVTSLGRIWRPRSLTWESGRCQIVLGKKVWTLPQLILLAKNGEKRVPDGMTVDHINGREGEWPHRMDNLRWATRAEQNQNRDCL
jgi:hypothetical protein